MPCPPPTGPLTEPLLDHLGFQRVSSGSNFWDCSLSDDRAISICCHAAQAEAYIEDREHDHMTFLKTIRSDAELLDLVRVLKPGY